MIFSSLKESAELNKKSTAVATIYGLDKECNNNVGEIDVCVYDPGGGTNDAITLTPDFKLENGGVYMNMKKEAKYLLVDELVSAG